MIFYTFLLAAVAVSVSATDDYVPDCSQCDYYEGIGYIAHPSYCRVYYVCYRKPYDPNSYKFELLCCPEGQSFDEEHLTCVWDSKLENECTQVYVCPDLPPTTDLPCPYESTKDPATYKILETGDLQMCAWGTVWNQANCTCAQSGEHLAPCNKIMHFDFDNTYDSFSCHNFVDGTPHGSPKLDDTVLCLNGKREFLTIAYFNNYFAWNPVGKTFSLCFWMKPSTEAATEGVFSTNCYYEEEGSVFDVCLDGGQLVVKLGSNEEIPTGEYPPTNEFSKVCVTFDNGLYILYFNGQPIHTLQRDPHPINSQNAATLGYVDDDYKDSFYGYFDDFCFWDVVLDEDEIKECYEKGPSNTYYAPV